MPVLVVMPETICGCWALNASRIGWVSCRFPATSRMFSDTGLAGAVASVLGGAAFAELDDPGAPHAASKGAAPRRLPAS